MSGRCLDICDSVGPVSTVPVGCILVARVENRIRADREDSVGQVHMFSCVGVWSVTSIVPLESKFIRCQCYCQ